MPPVFLTAIFDGQCLVCQNSRALISRLDWLGRIQFVDLHDHQQAHAAAPQISTAQAMGQIHVIDRHGRIFAGFDAVHRMLRALPLMWPVWALLCLPGMRPVGKRVYRAVARRRYTINRLFGVSLTVCEEDSCRVP